MVCALGTWRGWGWARFVQAGSGAGRAECSLGLGSHWAGWEGFWALPADEERPAVREERGLWEEGQALEG